ncbi:hypothetical protein R6Q59_018600 [Mikania micrantha]
MIKNIKPGLQHAITQQVVDNSEHIQQRRKGLIQDWDIISSSLGTAFAIAALCCHSVFEGNQIGIADSKAYAWKLWTYDSQDHCSSSMGFASIRMMSRSDRDFYYACAAYVRLLLHCRPIGVGNRDHYRRHQRGSGCRWIFAISMGIACGGGSYTVLTICYETIGLQKTALSHSKPPFSASCKRWDWF